MTTYLFLTGKKATITYIEHDPKIILFAISQLFMMK